MRLTPVRPKSTEKPMPESERKALEAQRERERLQRSKRAEWDRQKNLKETYERHLRSRKYATLSDEHQKKYDEALRYLREQPNPYLR